MKLEGKNNILVKKFLGIVVLGLFFSIKAYSASITEELTQLNNLYKEGAITEEEFSKAKSILLKTNSSKEQSKTKKVNKKEKSKKLDQKTKPKEEKIIAKKTETNEDDIKSRFNSGIFFEDDSKKYTALYRNKENVNFVLPEPEDTDLDNFGLSAKLNRQELATSNAPVDKVFAGKIIISFLILEIHLMHYYVILLFDHLNL